MKTAKLDFPGKVHEFVLVKDLSKKESLWRCKNCGLEALRLGEDKFATVVLTKKFKETLETCTKPKTQGEKEITMKKDVKADKKK